MRPDHQHLAADRGQEGQGVCRDHLEAPGHAAAQGPAHTAGIGLKGFEITIWHGLYAPKGTPPAVTKKLNDALKVALKDPDFIKKQEGLGAVVASDNRVEPAEHKKFVAAEIAKWSPIIKAAGVYAD